MVGFGRPRRDAYGYSRKGPYPMAIFRQNGDLVYVNSAMSQRTGLYADELTLRKHGMLDCITDANLMILDAAEDVFVGKTTFVTGLSDPLDIFVGERLPNTSTSPSEYHDAVFFAIAEDEGQTTLGAVIFIN